MKKKTLEKLISSISDKSFIVFELTITNKVIETLMFVKHSLFKHYLSKLHSIVEIIAFFQNSKQFLFCKLSTVTTQDKQNSTF